MSTTVQMRFELYSGVVAVHQYIILTLVRNFATYKHEKVMCNINKHIEKWNKKRHDTHASLGNG